MPPATNSFSSRLEAKVAQQLGSQRVGYLLGAGHHISVEMDTRSRGNFGTALGQNCRRPSAKRFKQSSTVVLMESKTH
jgi:hypothetical protein